MGIKKVGYKTKTDCIKQAKNTKLNIVKGLKSLNLKFLSKQSTR